ncbi:MAG: J domain-containing protein [Smithellaceae bacterium]|nr:J domain-containing protein [Smithellaceae bacterium]
MTRSGLLEAIHARFATFYFTDDLIVMDVMVHDVRDVFRFSALRTKGCRPADDFGKMANRMGEAWWEEEKRTKRKYLASRKLLELAERLTILEGLVRPRLIRVPTVKPESLQYLGMNKAERGSRELAKLIKNAYRRQVKVHHPDAGGEASTFRKLHDAYQELLRWAENPTFTRRRGFPDKWCYDGASQKWIQPVPKKTGEK